MTFLVKSECFSGGTVTNNENRLAISVFFCARVFCSPVNFFVGDVNVCSLVLLFVCILVLYLHVVSFVVSYKPTER